MLRQHDHEMACRQIQNSSAAKGFTCLWEAGQAQAVQRSAQRGADILKAAVGTAAQHRPSGDVQGGKVGLEGNVTWCHVQACEMHWMMRQAQVWAVEVVAHKQGGKAICWSLQLTNGIWTAFNGMSRLCLWQQIRPTCTHGLEGATAAVILARIIAKD